MNTLQAQRLDRFGILALVMVATRLGHIGSHLSLPDASWAVFFLAGFYLTRQWLWAFPLLMAEAAAIDFAAIGFFGVSNYCVTRAYWFLVPAYAALWCGGRWFRQRYTFGAGSLVPLLASLFVSVSVCYLITNGSFYWLSGRLAHPDFAGWVGNFRLWYLPFLRVPFIYVGVAAVLHVLAVQLGRLSGKTAAGARR